MPGPHVTPPGGPAPAHLEAIRRRLSEAQVLPAPSAALLVRHYRHSSAQMPGWVLLRERHVDARGRSGLLRASHLMLQAAGNLARKLKLEVYETTSPEAARELLVELLTAFETLPARLAVGHEVGDADVMLPLDRVRLFTRGNLAVAVSNAGTDLVAAGEAAQALDAFIVAPPLPERLPRAAALGRRAEATEAVAAASGEPMERYVAASGSLRQRDDGSIELVGGEEATTQRHVQGEGEAGWHEPPAEPDALPPGADDGKRRRKR